MLSGEPNDRFLKVLSFYEKAGVVESIDAWQDCRATRNLAAPDYEIEYAEIAKNFNVLHELTLGLYQTAARFLSYCNERLNIQPKQADFSGDFVSIVDH